MRFEAGWRMLHVTPFDRHSKRLRVQYEVLFSTADPRTGPSGFHAIPGLDIFVLRSLLKNSPILQHILPSTPWFIRSVCQTRRIRRDKVARFYADVLFTFICSTTRKIISSSFVLCLPIRFIRFLVASLAFDCRFLFLFHILPISTLKLSVHI